MATPAACSQANEGMAPPLVLKPTPNVDDRF
jgi:hypothetical protein|eukprot:SAG25_NODE_208_length_11851_cov_12.361896_7_plen_31_part_00